MQVSATLFPFSLFLLFLLVPVGSEAAQQSVVLKRPQKHLSAALQKQLVQALEARGVRVLQAGASNMLRLTFVGPHAIEFRRADRRQRFQLPGHLHSPIARTRTIVLLMSSARQLLRPSAVPARRKRGPPRPKRSPSSPVSDVKSPQKRNVNLSQTPRSRPKSSSRHRTSPRPRDSVTPKLVAAKATPQGKPARDRQRSTKERQGPSEGARATRRVPQIVDVQKAETWDKGPTGGPVLGEPFANKGASPRPRQATRTFWFAVALSPSLSFLVQEHWLLGGSAFVRLGLAQFFLEGELNLARFALQSERAILLMRPAFRLGWQLPLWPAPARTRLSLDLATGAAMEVFLFEHSSGNYDIQRVWGLSLSARLAWRLHPHWSLFWRVSSSFFPPFLFSPAQREHPQSPEWLRLSSALGLEFRY